MHYLLLLWRWPIEWTLEHWYLIFICIIFMFYNIPQECRVKSYWLYCFYIRPGIICLKIACFKMHAQWKLPKNIMMINICLVFLILILIFDMKLYDNSTWFFILKLPFYMETFEKLRWYYKPWHSFVAMHRHFLKHIWDM